MDEKEQKSGEAAQDGHPRKKGPVITRRGAIALAGLAALSGLLPWTSAWAVGGGAWGNAGGTAYIGSSFGYDGGWGYSTSRKVWLSVRASCNVLRMSELLCEISVASYYANAGYWHPTWKTDYADTHVRSYIANSSGTWLSSVTGYYDTTYDNTSYHGPYATDVHTIRRESSNYSVQCVVNAWCDSPDNANGIDTYATARQTIPRHTLNDDKSWRKKIFTMSPKSSPGYYLDASGGGVGKGTNLNFWSKLETTSQCWISCDGARGLTVLEPAHVSDANICIDHSGGASDVWGGTSNVHLWEYLGKDNQLIWLHDLGNGYHYPVFHHSGMALAHAGSSCTNGTNAQMWNSYASYGTAGPMCSYKLEEVTWRERSEGAMTVSGSPEAGEALTPADPNEKCIPYNYPGTSGMYYRYTWYRGKVEGELATVVQGPSETGPYVVTRDDEGSYLTCVVEARTRYWDIKYKGSVTLPSIAVPYPFAEINYYVDSSATPCFTEQRRIRESYSTNPDAAIAGTKDGCAGFKRWYTDAACTNEYVEGTILQRELKLYGYNEVTLEYSTTARSSILDPGMVFYADEAKTVPATSENLYPAKSIRRWGDRVTFVSGLKAYYDDAGHDRVAVSGPIYATDGATGAPMTTAALTRNTVAYVDWPWTVYDGVAAGW